MNRMYGLPRGKMRAPSFLNWVGMKVMIVAVVAVAVRWRGMATNVGELDDP